MKKNIFTFILALAMILTLGVPALAADGNMDYVIDIDNNLSYSDWETLEDAAAEISQRNGCGVYIVIADDYSEYADGTAYEAAKQIYDSDSRFGVGSERDGIMLLISMTDRSWAIYVNGSNAEYALDDYAQQKLEDAFLPKLSDDDWCGGYTAYLSTCDELLTLAGEGEPVRESPVKGILTVVGISCVIALLICLVLKGKMKTVRHKTEAKKYVIGGIQLTQRYDNFTHNTETRRKIESSSNNSSSGSGSGGSGKF